MATFNHGNFDDSELNVPFSKEILRLYGYPTHFKPKSHGYNKASFRLEMATLNHEIFDESVFEVFFSKEILRLYGYLTHLKPKNHGYSKASFRLQVATLKFIKFDDFKLKRYLLISSSYLKSY